MLSYPLILVDKLENWQEPVLFWEPLRPPWETPVEVSHSTGTFIYLPTASMDSIIDYQDNILQSLFYVLFLTLVLRL